MNFNKMALIFEQYAESTKSIHTTLIGIHTTLMDIHKALMTDDQYVKVAAVKVAITTAAESSVLTTDSITETVTKALSSAEAFTDTAMAESAESLAPADRSMIEDAKLSVVQPTPVFDQELPPFPQHIKKRPNVYPTKEKKTFFIAAKVMKEIEQTIGLHRSERGGMLGGCRKTGHVTHYFFDRTASCSGVTYSPDTDTVNQQLQVWNAEDIDLMGFVHSHPGNFGRPSGGDLVYAKRIIAVCESMDVFYMPIVNTKPETGKFSLFSYYVGRDGQMLPANHEIT